MASKFKKRLGRLSKAPGKETPAPVPQRDGESVNVEPVQEPSTSAGTGRPQFSRVKRKRVASTSNPFRSEAPKSIKTAPQSLPGEEGEVDGYTYRVVREEHSREHAHGSTQLAGIFDLSSETLSLLCLEALETVPSLERWLFLDTETTGLAGGTGTLPFVLGWVRWNGTSWVTEQYILEKPGKERGMLQMLTQRLEGVDVLVTYNGKSYDWPLIKSRCIMNRLKEPVLKLHLDLLHVFRRLYGKELDDVKLTTIEKERLGFERVDDLPGSEVPEVYFKYLRTGRPERFAGVVKHNVDDLLAMVAMVSHLHTTLSRPEVSLSMWAELAVAKMHLRLKDDSEALVQLRRGLEGGEVGSEAWYKSLEMAGALLKKRGAFSEAIRLFEEAEKISDHLDEATLESLAKLYEHQAKALDDAKRCARELVERFPSVAHEHRLRRLEEKLNRG